MSLHTVLSMTVLVFLFSQGTSSNITAFILQIRNVENAEANLLLEDVVSREMTDCSLLIAFDGHHSLIPLRSSVIWHHHKGLGLLDITNSLVSGISLKVREEYDSLVCHGLLVLVRETSWKSLMELGIDAWAGLPRIFFLILQEKNATSAEDAAKLLANPSLRLICSPTMQRCKAASQDQHLFHAISSSNQHVYQTMLVTRYGVDNLYTLFIDDRCFYKLPISRCKNVSTSRFTLNAAAAVKGKQQWTLYSNSLFVGTNREAAHPVDVWSPQNQFRLNTSLFDPKKMSDLQGYDFAVAALPYSPFIMVVDDTLLGPGKYKGLEVLLLDALAEAANFTYHYVAPEDGEWGRLKPSGQWTGMIGMVTTEEADWAVSDITFSSQREEYVDFCEPFVYDASELVTPRAKLLPQWLGPVRPYNWKVWVGIVIMVAFSGPFLCFLATYYTGSSTTYVRYFQEVGNAVMYTLQPVFQRGHPNDIHVTPGRLFIGTWQIFTMIIGISYSSSLTSFLVFPGFQKPIENLQQLVKSDIGWGKVNFGGIQNAILEQTKDPVLIALREGVQWRSSLDGILHDVAKGTLATWDNSITTRLTIAVKFTDSKGQPLVHLPGFELLQERIAWPMQQHAPYKQRFDELIARVVQAGLVQKWLKQLIFEEQALARKKNIESQELEENTEQAESGQVVLSLEHFQGPFFVLFLGYIAGALALVLEVSVATLLQSPAKSKFKLIG
ncbi:glutamate receptor ionotropic, delta-1-like [Palaemon carinicauda]|uniref:glutamate receptor ionotropic, delta-1-like n=1 Tax=Palaemon carinicauda TaxID=392227 RepID=UPI0035B5E551